MKGSLGDGRKYVVKKSEVIPNFVGSEPRNECREREGETVSVKYKDEIFLRDGYTMTSVALPDSLLNNNLPNNPSTDRSCDGKTGNSLNDFVPSSAMTLSGLTTSSGFQDSPDKSPDEDAELSDQFVDKTMIQKFILPGYLFQHVFVRCSVIR